MPRPTPTIFLEYLEREAGSRIAEDYGRRFRAAIVRFVDLPETGARRPALGQNVRIAIVYPYIFVYEYTPREDVVTLLRVLHGRRNITRELLKTKRRSARYGAPLLAASASFTAALISASVNGFRITSWISASRF